MLKNQAGARIHFLNQRPDSLVHDADEVFNLNGEGDSI